MIILLTGAAGFIGSHTAKALLERDYTVIGVDNLNNYYDPKLKYGRLAGLSNNPNFSFHEADISDTEAMNSIASKQSPDAIVHLAAQAGVRYSIENPSAYTSANLVGHSVILELARKNKVTNMVYASSSSVYGGNTSIPFSETDITDDPVSYYGATKKSNELLSNSYSRLYGISLTGLRFFTVYGPWGRPDMAYWIFTDKMLAGEPIRIFNNGNMERDFTYVDDIVSGILASLDNPASKLGLAVPHRIYNLGNDRPEKLMNLVKTIEQSFGITSKKIYEPMQIGDVQKTWANIDRARKELNYKPTTSLKDGINFFSNWYKEWRKH